MDLTASDLSSDLAALLERIHASPHRMVMNFAGAGSQALLWLHSVGGSSRTVSEATDRYSPASLAEAVGYVPRRFTSPKVARALAANALKRAAKLNPPLSPLSGSARRRPSPPTAPSGASTAAPWRCKTRSAP